MPTARSEKTPTARTRNRATSGKAEKDVRKRPHREATLNLRISLTTRELIDTAAEASGKSRTEFVLDSARQQAVDVLLDRRLFHFDEKAMQSFLHLLDNPPEPNALLRDLMTRKAPWER